MIEVGQQVEVKQLGIVGRVEYIDRPSLLNHWEYPIQLKLERGYDDTGHRTYRVNLKEIRPVKRYVDRKEIKAIRKEIKSFLKGL